MKDRVVNSRSSAIAIGAGQEFSVMADLIFLARLQENTLRLFSYSMWYPAISMERAD